MHRLVHVGLCLTLVLASRTLAAAPPEAKCEAPAVYRATAPVTTCAATGSGGFCSSPNHRVCACD